MNRYKDTWGSTSNRINRLIVTTKEKGSNVLTASVLREAARLDGLVSDRVYASAGLTEDEPTGLQSFGQTYGRANMCYPKASQPDCLMTNYALELFYFSASGTYDFDYTDAEIAEIVQRGYGIDPALFPDGAQGRKARLDQPTAPRRRQPLPAAPRLLALRPCPPPLPSARALRPCRSTPTSSSAVAPTTTVSWRRRRPSTYGTIMWARTTAPSSTSSTVRGKSRSA